MIRGHAPGLLLYVQADRAAPFAKVGLGGAGVARAVYAADVEEVINNPPATPGRQQPRPVLGSYALIDRSLVAAFCFSRLRAAYVEWIVLSHDLRV